MTSTFGKLSLDRQLSILNAAASVFAEEGYHYARISKICEMSGVSNGALYKYFKNKEDLFFAVLDRGVSLVVSELYSKFTVNSESLFLALKDFFRGLVSFTEEHRDYMVIYSDLGSSSMKRFVDLGSDKFERAASAYTIQMVDESKARGEVKKEIRSDMAAYLIDNYITFFVYSLVSEYHVKRFDSFFTQGETVLSVEERIELTMKSIEHSLK